MYIKMVEKCIVTCSTKLTDEEQKQNIHHSGAGRIGKIRMHTMSLYESGDSTGKVSLKDMLNGNKAEVYVHCCWLYRCYCTRP